MFQELKNQETEQKPDIQAFLALYAKFQAGAAWLAKRREAGQDNTPHLAAFRALETQVDKKWEIMSGEQRNAILSALVERGAIPGEVNQVREMFGGKLVKIT